MEVEDCGRLLDECWMLDGVHWGIDGMKKVKMARSMNVDLMPLVCWRAL